MRLQAGKSIPLAAAAAVPLDKLSRKELQTKAIAAGLKGNAKSVELIAALKALESAGKAGEALLGKAGEAKMVMKATSAFMVVSSPERKELEDLAFLGITGKTPGGTRYRSRGICSPSTSAHCTAPHARYTARASNRAIQRPPAGLPSARLLRPRSA